MRKPLDAQRCLDQLEVNRAWSKMSAADLGCNPVVHELLARYAASATRWDREKREASEQLLQGGQGEQTAPQLGLWHDEDKDDDDGDAGVWTTVENKTKKKNKSQRHAASQRHKDAQVVEPEQESEAVRKAGRRRGGGKKKRPKRRQKAKS